MKNFSTVGARLVGAALLAGVMATPAQAKARCEFRANAPDQHTVVKHDTLWDISGKFLEHPWCWPQVWGMNKAQIRDPHWIYPHQVIYLDRANGRLTLVRPGNGSADSNGITRISPQIRTEGMGLDAIQSIASNVIEPFLSQPLVVDEATLGKAPRIAATREARVTMGKDDTAYVKGELNGISSFQVFRPGTPLRNPDDNKILGYEAVYLGTVKLQKEAKPGVDVHTFIVASSKMEMSVGDLLVPSPPLPIRNYVPHEPDQKINARVVSVYAGVTHAGQNQVLSINRGSVDGVDVGTVLQLYNVGKVVKDTGGKLSRMGNTPTIRLPDEHVGTLFIFRVFDKISYGLIMQVTEPVEVGDVARSSE
ncbi:LysM peptidoglycan-binding domain-containing protein [Massilia glaciei]|uniref:LysM peptidoglycan-binding domain-containing protein n=1 Tax=Massilia glaciei TaxID=1524097 RepID=A0A2U2I5C3_9BURK|nr:LysM peptidoglycan-binding domain-containing protein [Massilia glaciei]